jgi:itaconate CoA-transferase
LAHPSIVPYGSFDTADCRQIVIAVQNDREWRVLRRTVLGQAALAEDARFANNRARMDNRVACESLVAARIGELRHSAVQALLSRAEIAFGSVNSVPDLLRHPHLRQTVVGTPSGPATVVKPATCWTERTYVGGSVPALGEHNDALRAEFG